MLKKLKKALVNSFVSALALGWLFAQAVLHFAYVFSSPVAGWLTRREYYRMTDHPVATFSLQDATPELVKSFSMLLIGYLLLRWLYYKPLESETSESEQEQ